MTEEYLTAREIKQMLIEAMAIQRRQLSATDFDADPATGRMSSEEGVEALTELLGWLRHLPDDDVRLVRLAEMVPTAEMFVEMIPDDGKVPMTGPAMLDYFVERAYNGRP